MLVGPGDAAVPSPSGKLHDHRVDGDAVARLDADFLDDAVALGAQDVFHLHRLDHGQRLAGLDLLALGDRDRDDRPGIGQRTALPLSESFFTGISRA